MGATNITRPVYNKTHLLRPIACADDLAWYWATAGKVIVDVDIDVGFNVTSARNLVVVTIQDLVCMRRCGWMDDTGIRRMKRWSVRVGELGMEYGELRIGNECVN